eukprot:CAMPEP_0204858882 /NCGR_PEP_ID=MMETSP1347-20130617/23359_1 /ASSEMBLY_ACC=CAM_ASM_000690 /TAXON_ID=215587 /ORGANISM="Aplanochytrium stocchinoi, Strain GSBS06" /LENGTH=227 /DNA_ID=CAMNT_0052007237 /DNA_START=171 /DNA_END=854 /DNA_ORIENTATION=+
MEPQIGIKKPHPSYLERLKLQQFGPNAIPSPKRNELSRNIKEMLRKGFSIGKIKKVTSQLLEADPCEDTGVTNSVSSNDNGSARGTTTMRGEVLVREDPLSFPSQPWIPLVHEDLHSVFSSHNSTSFSSPSTVTTSSSQDSVLQCPLQPPTSYLSTTNSFLKIEEPIINLKVETVEPVNLLNQALELGSKRSRSYAYGYDDQNIYESGEYYEHKRSDLKQQVKSNRV